MRRVDSRSTSPRDCFLPSSSDGRRFENTLASRGHSPERCRESTTHIFGRRYRARGVPYGSHSNAHPSFSATVLYARDTGRSSQTDERYRLATDQGYRQRQYSVGGSYVGSRDPCNGEATSTATSGRTPTSGRYDISKDRPLPYYGNNYETSFSDTQPQQEKHQDYRYDGRSSQDVRQGGHQNVRQGILLGERYRQDLSRQIAPRQVAPRRVAPRQVVARPDSYISELYVRDRYTPDSYRADSYGPGLYEPNPSGLDSYGPYSPNSDPYSRYKQEPYSQDVRSRSTHGRDRYDQNSHRTPRNQSSYQTPVYRSSYRTPGNQTQGSQNSYQTRGNQRSFRPAINSREYKVRESYEQEPYSEPNARYENAALPRVAPNSPREKLTRKRNTSGDDYYHQPSPPKDRIGGFNRHRGAFERGDCDDKRAFDHPESEKSRYRRKNIRGEAAARLAYNFEKGRVYGDGENDDDVDGPTQEEVILGADPSFGNCDMVSKAPQKDREGGFNRHDGAFERGGFDDKRACDDPELKQSRYRRQNIRGEAAAKLAYNFEKGRVYGDGEDDDDNDGPTQEEVILGADPSFGNCDTVPGRTSKSARKRRARKRAKAARYGPMG